MQCSLDKKLPKQGFRYTNSCQKAHKNNIKFSHKQSCHVKSVPNLEVHFLDL